MLLHRLALAVLLANVATAQVSPAGHQSQEGNTATFFPIGIRQQAAANRQVHYQQVHDDVTNKVIRSIAFRRDSRAEYFYPIPALRADLELAMSTARTKAGTISNNFAANEGTDRKIVTKRKTINFPKTVKLHGVAPQPLFAYRIAFDTAFIRQNTGSLCWDMKVYGNTVFQSLATPLYLDTMTKSAANVPGFTASYGRGCFSSNRGVLRPAETSSQVLYTRSTNRIQVAISGCHFTPNTNGFAMIGLRPANVDLTAIGAPGCRLLQSWSAQFPVKLDSRGQLGRCAGQNSGPVITPIGTPTLNGLVLRRTHNTSFEGLKLYAQIYAGDPGANPLGIVVGNATQAVVPQTYPQGVPANRVYRSGRTAMTAAAGLRSTTTPWAVVVSF